MSLLTDGLLMKIILKSILLFIIVLVTFGNFSAQPRKAEQSLDGNWEFRTDPSGQITIKSVGQTTEWRTIKVPYSWNSQFAELRNYHGAAWYRRTVVLPSIGSQQTILLNFGAVDYYAAVYVNGQLAGENEGGYLPFSLDIGKYVKSGKNELIVQVIDPDNLQEQWPAAWPVGWPEKLKQIRPVEISAGRQRTFIPTGGIWQSVSWEVRPVSYLTAARVTALLGGEVEVHIERQLSPRGGGTFSPAPVEVTILDPAGRAVGREIAKLTGTESVLTAGLKVGAPRRWSPESPTLYRIEVRYGNDTLSDQFGFRRFESRQGQLFLNGEPIYLTGALDYDFHPEGIYTPPAYPQLIALMRQARQLGFNLLRTHAKVPAPEYLRAADETGMMIWYEVPGGMTSWWSSSASQRTELTFLGQLRRDWNHPSVIIQSILNESQGLGNISDRSSHQWLKAAYQRFSPEAAKAGRMIIDNSPCCVGFHLVTDIVDFHDYKSIPDRRKLWDFWLTQFASRPDWLWSWFGDANRSDSAPLVVSEFGTWGLPELPSSPPWWLEHPTAEKLDLAPDPREVTIRLRQLKLDRIFPTFNDFARATQLHQWTGLKHQIEELRRHHSIQGYVVSALSDVAWEARGLLDMSRRPKFAAERLVTIQAPDIVFARPASRNYTGGEIIELVTWVSRHSQLATERLSVHYLVGDQEVNQLEIPAQVRGAVYKDIWKNIKAPQVSAPQPLTIRLELRQGAKVIHRNELTVFVYPLSPGRSGTIVLNERLYKMEAGLVAAGYTIVSAPSKDSVIITDQIDELTFNYLRAGHRVLHLAMMPEGLPGGKLRVIPRQDNLRFVGDYVTNFNWVDTARAPFKGVAFSPILGFESDMVGPGMVIDGVEPAGFSDVMAGISLGWLNSNGVLMMGAQIGPGKAILTTFELAPSYASDPYARHLVDQSIELLRQESFKPGLQLLSSNYAGREAAR